MDTKREEVERFLADFKQKHEVFGVVFLRDRTKNLQTELKLELKGYEKEEYLKRLEVQHYYKGPTDDVDGGAELWEFGMEIKKQEVYIKITLGQFSKPVVCISFHSAERKIKYPFK